MKTKTVTLPPPPLHGVHGSLYNRACLLHEAGATFESAMSAMLEWRDTNAFRPGRFVGDFEVVHAVQAAYRRSRSPRSGAVRRCGVFAQHRWPAPSPQMRAKAIIGLGGLAELRASSPVPLTGETSMTAWILEALYPEDPLLCCAWSSRDFATMQRSKWLDAASMALIVPSPMRSVFGRRKSDGAFSAHTADNTGDRRFLVLDFDDDAGLDVHAGATEALRRRFPFPLVMALYSGGKSLHAWFFVAHRPESEVRSMMRAACVFGADSRMWTPCQFARMPDGLRDNGKRQTVYYFNPEVSK